MCRPDVYKRQPQEELEKFRKDKSGVIELTDVSRSGALTIVRYVDSNQVFYEAHRMMKYFLFCMVLVLSLIHI